MIKNCIVLILILSFLRLGDALGQTYKITVNVNDFSVVKENGYDVISYPHSNYLDDSGAPMMPILQFKYIIPQDQDVQSVKVNYRLEKKLPGNFLLYPTQPEKIISISEGDIFIDPRKSIYSSDNQYPIEPIVRFETGFMGGSKICLINYSPLKYIPKTGEIRVIEEIQFEFEYKYSSKEFVTSENLTEKAYNTLSANIKSNIINIDEYQSRTAISKRKTAQLPLSMPKNQTDYVIITNDELSSSFQAIADWKTKKGLPAKVITTEWIYNNFEGGDAPEKIREFIKYAFKNWGAIWFLLGGDSSIVPVRQAWSSHFGHYQLEPKYPKGIFIETDMYYACLDGTWNKDGDSVFGESSYDIDSNGKLTFKSNTANIDDVDLFYDVFVGRIPVRNKMETESFKKKYFNYIKDYFVDANKMLLFSANSDGITCSEMDAVKKGIPQSKTVDCLYECAGSNLSNCGVKSDVLSSIKGYDKKYHIVCGYGHGSTYSFEACDQDISSNELNTSDYNTTKIILYNNHCETLPWSKESIGRKFVANEGGGIAYIGNSHYGWTGDPSRYNKPFMTNLLGSNFQIGRAFYNAKGAGAIYDTYARWTLFTLGLAGDPELEVWTDTPKDLSVSAKATSSTKIGETNVSVEIKNLDASKNETATICIMKGAESYRVDDNIIANGVYDYSITSHTSDSIHVTVTSHNYVPVEISIADPSNFNTNIWISDLTFDDDKKGKSKGNGDKQLDAGETIELSILLKNTGKNTASSVSAILQSDSSYITIIDSIVNFGNIAPNSVQRFSTKYLFKIKEDAPQILKDDLNPVTFYLKITDSEKNNYSDQFNIDLYNTELEQANKTIVSTSNGNSTIEAGETVKLKVELLNKGKSEATGVTAALKSTGSYISSISSPVSAYPTISHYKTGENTVDFEFKVASNYVVGAALDFILEVTNEFGKKQTFTFNLLDRPSQVATSGMDFTGFEHAIELKWKAIVQSGLKGYNVYRSSVDSNGNSLNVYSKVNALPVTNAYFRDYNLSAFTRYYYKITAVSSTGNESPFSNPILVWTMLPSKEPFPILMDNSIGTHINTPIAYDIDGDGQQEIFSSIRSYNLNTPPKGYLIGIDNNGVDLFDLDNNVTTHSGFADVKTRIWGNVSLGDLYGTGETQIVSATREETQNGDHKNYVFCHSMKDINPKDGVPDFNWNREFATSDGFYRGTVIANIDNSPDGSMETILCTDGGKLVVLDQNGNTLWSTELAEGGAAQIRIAVADLNNDGLKEIIVPSGSSIYVFDYAGNPYVKSPFYTKNGYDLKSSVVVCDLNNDGKNEIIAVVKSANASIIQVIDSNGALLSGWGTNQYAQTSYGAVSVGDLNNDGHLEVVALCSKEKALKVWSHTGSLLLNKSISDISGEETPILADIDGDNEIEMLFIVKNRIECFKLNGNSAAGFPMQIDKTLAFVRDLCVSDIDNDGKNEILASSGDCNIHVWRTQGKSDKIEWGSVRSNAQNTGEYGKVCPPTVIKTNTTLSSTEAICGNIVVESGTLTLNSTCNLNMDNTSLIIVKKDATLSINGGKIYNANIKGLDGSYITLTNNAYVKLRSNGELNINKGCAFNNNYGTIDK